MSAEHGENGAIRQDEAVRAELNRLLESAPFRTSKRCSEFLKYVVERALSGQSSNLKERLIGIELFQLPPDFDTSQHAIVRVTANEVRKRLAQYYLADGGSHHPVRIDLPPGSYTPEFKWDVPIQKPRGKKEVTWKLKRFLLPAIAVAVTVVVLVGLAMWRRQADKPATYGGAPNAAIKPVQAVLPHEGDLRISVGSTSSYTDRNGRSWEPDRFFSGGIALTRTTERIYRTLDPDIYRRLRVGDFRYDIPLKPGFYELHLHFAETGLSDSMSMESSGEGQRIFLVTANGKPLLELFDVVADAAGANIADERVFRDITPAADGFLHLSFTSLKGSAILSGIELLPVGQGKVRPIRIRAGWPASWVDGNRQQWLADSYFLGGNALVRTKNPVEDGFLTQPDAALYASERWGHFSYAVPVADGQYRVTLRFCEGHYGKRNTGVGGVGSRLFDVYCNGVALLREFDIFKQAGGEGRPVSRTFSGIRPTAQGKIVLTFVPVKGMACVNGIEIVEDTK